MVEEIHLGKSYKSEATAEWIDFSLAFERSKTPVFIRVDQPGSKYHDSVMEITPIEGEDYHEVHRNRSNLNKIHYFNPIEWWQAQYQTKKVIAWLDVGSKEERMDFSLLNKNFIWLKGYQGPTVAVINDTKKAVPLFDQLGQPIVVGELCVVGGPEPSFAVVTKTQGQYAFVKRIVGGYESEHGLEKKIQKLTNIFMITDDLKSKIMLEKLKKAI